MSRLINLRSPYFIKLTANTGLTLSSATAHVYVWTGNITDRPSEPAYTLAKSINPLQNFIVFEISELARDFIDVTFDGSSRITEPVYIGLEVTKLYTNNTVDSESFLVFGLDGYVDHNEGIQATENLILGLNVGDGSGGEQADVGDAATLIPVNNLFARTTGDADQYTVTYPSTFTDVTLTDITLPTWLTASDISGSVTTGAIKTQTFTLTTGEENITANARSGNVSVEYGSGASETVTVIASQAGTAEQGNPTVQIDSDGDGEENRSLIVPIGTSATLRAINASDPAGGTLTYQWYRGGQAVTDAISGETGTSYVVTDTNAGAEDYYVSVTSSVSTLTGFSQRFRLTHQNIPLALSITTDIGGSDNVVVVQNDQVVFTATALGSAASGATIRWYRDSTSNEITAGLSNNNRTLTLNVGLGDTGRYFAIATPLSGDTVTSNSISISITGMPGTINRDINSTLSDPLTFGNSIGSFRDVTYTYTASVYEDILASDITDITNAPAAWITPTIQSHTIVGDNKVTVVRYTTNATHNALTARDGRKAITVRLLSGALVGRGSFTDFMRQNAVASIGNLTYSSTSVGVGGGSITFSVSGDTGATYNLNVNDISPSGWINNTALSETTGTVGDVHTLTIPANDTVGPRTLNVIATNSLASTNRAVGTVVTQAEPSPFVRANISSLSFVADVIPGSSTANADIMTFRVESNTGWEATLPAGSNFRFFFPEIGGVPAFTSTTARGNTGSPVQTRTVANGLADTVRVQAMDNTLSQELRDIINIRYTAQPDTTTVQDTVSITQAGATAQNEFRRSDGGDVDSITAGIGSSNAVSVQIRSTGSWSIFQNNTNTGTGPANVTLSTNRGTGNATITAHFATTPVAGSAYSLTLSGSGLPTDTLTVVPTSTVSAPTDLTFAGSTLNVIDGQDAPIVMNAQSGLDITYRLFLGTSPGGTQVGSDITNNTGSATVTIPTASLSLGSNAIYFTATNSVGTTTSDANTVTVNSAAVFDLNVSRTSINFPAAGGSQGVLVSGAPFTDWRASVTSGTGYTVSPTSGTTSVDAGFTVRATSTASATGEVTVTEVGATGSATIALTRSSDTISASPSVFAVGANGGTGSFNVDVSPGAWTAQVLSGAARLSFFDQSSSTSPSPTLTLASSGNRTVYWTIGGLFVDDIQTSTIRLTRGTATFTVTITQTGQAPGGSSEEFLREQDDRFDTF